MHAGHVDAAWWKSLFVYNGSKGSGRGPWVTGRINALFPWADSSKSQPKADGLAWVGVEEKKFSFPDGVSSTPLLWTYLGQAVPMKAWAGSLCACVSEDGGEVAPAVCVGFTIDAQVPAPEASEAP